MQCQFYKLIKNKNPIHSINQLFNCTNYIGKQTFQIKLRAIVKRNILFLKVGALGLSVKYNITSLSVQNGGCIFTVLYKFFKNVKEDQILY